MFDQGLNQEYGFDNSIVGNNNVINNDMNVDVDFNLLFLKPFDILLRFHFLL